MSPETEWNFLARSGLAARRWPGADGVDEDEVGFVEPGGGVGFEGVGRGGEGAAIHHADALGAEGAEVEPDGGGARGRR